MLFHASYMANCIARASWRCHGTMKMECCPLRPRSRRGLFLRLSILGQLAKKIARRHLYSRIARIAALLTITMSYSYEMTFAAIFTFDFTPLDRGRKLRPIWFWHCATRYWMCSPYNCDVRAWFLRMKAA